MELTDLNLALTHCARVGDVNGMEACLQYSLQPITLLRAIYTSKQYQILPRVLPFLGIAKEISVSFDREEFRQLLLAVCLDLYKSGNQAGFEACLLVGKLHVEDFLHFILALEKEAEVCFQRLVSQYKIELFGVIVERDDVLFFRLYLQTINAEWPTYSEYATLARGGAINILRSMGVAESKNGSDCCIQFILPSISPHLERREKQLRLLKYLKSKFGFGSKIEDFFVRSFEPRNELEVYFLLQAGFKPSEETMQELKLKNKNFYSKIFKEDV